MCTWLAITWWTDGKPSLVGALTGAVAGLACITPAAGYVPTWAAFVFGLLAGSGCYFAVRFKEYMKWDDALDVWACHGVGGVLGTILLGVFALKSVNPAGADGSSPATGASSAGRCSPRWSSPPTPSSPPSSSSKSSTRSADPVPDAVELKGLDDGEFGETAYNLT